MKLCKDCKHLGRSPVGNLNHCQRIIGTNLLDGGNKYVDEYCSIERSTGWLASRLFNYCGKEGRFFDSKEVTCSMLE